MEVVPSKRVASIGAYAFAAVDEKVAELKQQGITPIDFGVGDYADPTPEFIREACKAGVDRHATGGYPSYIGSQEYREAVAKWLQGRFGVSVNPATQIASTIGSKEGVFNFAEGFINPGEYAIIPSPGYPPYKRGTLFAEGLSHFVSVNHDNRCEYDLDSIPADVRQQARVMWITTPNSPTGHVASLEWLKRAYEFCRENDIILASDEAYSELYFEEPPHSLSKRSIMTGWRIGWVAGDKRIVDIFKKVKTNIDSGTPNFVQDAAIAALADEQHVEDLRSLVKQKRDLICGAMAKLGLPDCTPKASLYIWQKAPEGMSGEDFATLLIEQAHVVTTPGEWLSDEVGGAPAGSSASDGDGHFVNPGAGHVRFAMVPTLEEVKQAAEKIASIKLA